jgi:hypothetical protein
MLKALALLVAVVMVAGVALDVARRVVRSRAIARIPADRRVRVARGVTVRAAVQGGARLGALEPGRSWRLVGDLVLGPDRLIVGTTRGVLLDLRHGAAIVRSIRAPGPNRLVIEGAVPRPSGPPGPFRVEILVSDAAGWAAALAGFVGGA